jgi:hypothetical protein
MAQQKATEPAARFYRSLRAVKVLLASLRSTLTVLALRMRGRYRFALEKQLLTLGLAVKHSAQRILTHAGTILVDLTSAANCCSRKFLRRGFLTFLASPWELNLPVVVRLREYAGFTGSGLAKAEC